MTPLPRAPSESTPARSRRPSGRRGRAAVLPAAVAALIALGGIRASLEAQPVTESYPQLRAFIFGDVSYATSEREVDEGFLIGQLVGHAAATLSDRINVFTELTATARSEGGYAFEIERAIVRYDVSDALKLSLGRYHTPNSYWNTAFHHGLWLQTSVARPEPVRFGSLFLPTHFVGVQAEGRLPVLTALGLNYTVGVGNGRSESLTRAGDAGDVNDNRAVSLSLFARPPEPFGLRVGGSLHFDRASPETGPSVSERILSTHAIWEGNGAELLAEYARGRHEARAPASGEGHTEGGYVQVGYRLVGVVRELKPYLRGEWLEVGGADPLLAGRLEDYRAWLGGLRWDFASTTALKAELRGERVGDASWAATFIAQISFAIPNLGAPSVTGPAMSDRGVGAWSPRLASPGSMARIPWRAW